MDNAIFIIVQHSRRHLVSHGCYWLILLLGDVQRNPVPASFPCTVCRKAVKSKQNGVECTRCERWTHASCDGITLSEYKLLSDNKEEPWFCLSCELQFADSSLNSTDNTMADGRAPIGRGFGYLNCQVLNAHSIVNKRWDLQAFNSLWTAGISLRSTSMTPLHADYDPV